MAINWFEGGRRITKLLSIIVFVIGIGYVVIESRSDYVTFETTNPDRPWSFTTADCSYPDQSQIIERGIYLKREKDVELCFREIDGGILYKFSGYQEDQVIPGVVRTPPPLSAGPPRQTPLYYKLDGYTPEVIAYMAERKRSFVVSSEMFNAARDNQWKKKWLRKWHRFEEALPWVMGIVFGLWLVTFALGWIIRGFAGIPSGQDFKPKAN